MRCCGRVGRLEAIDKAGDMKAGPCMRESGFHSEEMLQPTCLGQCFCIFPVMNS